MGDELNGHNGKGNIERRSWREIYIYIYILLFTWLNIQYSLERRDN